MPWVERLKEPVDFSRVADLHPEAVQGIGDAECVGGIAAGECDDVVCVQLPSCFLCVCVERSIAQGRRGSVHFDRHMFQGRVDICHQNLSQHPDLVSHVAEFAAEVGGVSFGAPFGE